MKDYVEGGALRYLRHLIKVAEGEGMDDPEKSVRLIAYFESLEEGIVWADKYIRFVAKTQGIKFAPGEIAAYALTAKSERANFVWNDKTEEAKP